VLIEAEISLLEAELPHRAQEDVLDGQLARLPRLRLTLGKRCSRPKLLKQLRVPEILLARVVTVRESQFS
jgi:hypothetical protein